MSSWLDDQEDNRRYSMMFDEANGIGSVLHILRLLLACGRKWVVAQSACMAGRQVQTSISAHTSHTKYVYLLAHRTTSDKLDLYIYIIIIYWWLYTFIDKKWVKIQLSRQGMQSWKLQCANYSLQNATCVSERTTTSKLYIWMQKHESHHATAQCMQPFRIVQNLEGISAKLPMKPGGSRTYQIA